MRIDYLSRGTGWAHAARTALVAPALARRPGVEEVTIAASGSAVDYFAMTGLPYHDLRVPDELDHSGYAAYRIREHLRSRDGADRVVVSDELCLASLVCEAPCVLIVCSFRHYDAGPEAFGTADRILLAGWSEVEPVPEAIRSKVTAIGPIVRVVGEDRPTARRVLDLPKDALVVTASFGLFYPTKRDYFRDALSAVLGAWRHAPADAVLVIPLTSATVRELLGGVALPDNARCVGPTGRMDRYHRASNTVLTVGGSTTSHAVRNGIPTVVINPPAGSVESRYAAFLAGRCDHLTRTEGTESAQDLWDMIDHSAHTAELAPPDLRWGTADDVYHAARGT
ncbi:hypothetical protein SAMN05216188_13182 [Lentzea xinjiangensis]|uniref:UDP:flavonoid glycosyltransferase YjiC, YdhE family n=1 Tax=Lentzea xinjiangensis TaxID=402600 RepID=A0A1H9W9K9_9PSEU|nr:hypothetical protein [Lentzea xinjiangensis]SES30504.1 hypothetical protein SAMN05216188_13182 [Lentzea xinjiangensis]